MSTIKGTTTDSNMSVGGNLTVGGKAKVRGSVTVGHNLHVEGWLDAPNLKGASKGLFGSVDELKQAYANPRAGWWALVGDSLPADIYIVEAGEWQATGKKGGNPTIDVSRYESEVEGLKDEIQTVQGEIDENKQSIATFQTDQDRQDAAVEEVKTAQKKAEGNMTEYLALMAGTSANSDAGTYPQLHLGTFLTWASFNAKLDEIAKSTDNKYNGVLKANVNGTSVIVIQLALYLVSGFWTQMVIGTCKPSADGSQLEYAVETFVMKRDYKNGKMSAWSDIGATKNKTFFGVYESADNLPSSTGDGYAYVHDSGNTYKLYNLITSVWSDSGATVDLGDDNEELKTRVANNETKITAEGTRIDNLSSTVNTAKDELSASIQSLSDATDSKVSELKTQDSTLQSNIDAVSAKVDAQATTIAAQATSISNNQKSITAETTRAKTEENDIRQNMITGVSLEESNSVLQLIVSHGLDLSDDFYDIPYSVAGKSSGIVSGVKMKEIEDGINSNASAIKTEKSRATDAESALTSQLETTASSLNTRMGTIETAMSAIPSTVAITANATDLDDPSTFSDIEASSTDVANAAINGSRLVLVVTGPNNSAGVATKRSFTAISVESLDPDDSADGENYIDFIAYTGGGSGKKYFQLQLSAGSADVKVLA